MSVPSEEEAARSWAAPPPLPALQRRLSAPAAPGLAADKSTVPHWAASIYLIFTFLWEKVKEPLWLLTSFLLSVVWYCREQLLKWWTVCFQGKKNLTVSAEVDLLAYCAREWKGDTLQARDMRKAYENLFWRHHIKHLRQVRGDYYCVLRAVLFQIFSQGISFPSWMKEKEILKLPERLLYSQGCNWIQQFSFGPEKYTGSSVFIKLRKCLDFLKNQWTEIIGARDQEQREEMCRILFADEDKEYKLYEAVKFIMLYQVIEAHENMRNGQDIPSFFSLVFTRDTSSDPLSFMMNHLNSVGDTNGLDQVEMFLLGYSLEVKIKVFRLCMFGKEDFLACYPEEYPREWHEVFLVTEDDIHYIIPVVRR
ncbi:inactive ubiquitin thioesterase OTULINL isoform X1 [Rhinatrema bivittatum]|uniref:inactive ubiquitin thioesterase OTULINL isoform X1 n=1 Tax=Rhinatrema bivittatum TaxID=194408 RepID=UPI00112B5539|nr:inactive ubiquitin thioesterase OTULINL isoform X1 [Rhinatrema bivittatum]